MMLVLSGFRLGQEELLTVLTTLDLRGKKIYHGLAFDQPRFDQAWSFEFIVIAVPSHEHFMIGRHTRLEAAIGLNIHFALIRKGKMSCWPLELRQLAFKVVRQNIIFGG